jgi:FtsP/CotA-like multicopper oxidase with cupredoxin domain
MSRNQRLGLVALAVAVAVAAFLIARPSDDEEEGAGTGDQPAQTETTGTPDGETATEPAQPPRVERIALRGGTPQGGVRTLRYQRGETVRLVVTSDAADEIHVHGYDLTQNPAPGKPVRFRFEADIEGVFEVESHVAEDAGREPLVARLQVEP